uniref:Vacuolar protein sorting 13 homolog A n=1 Tax=Coturnix japonica TaxID=93934 RepID=A0A8C2TC19_COTJA
MVFESLVVDVLNRFLGDYVVNLDSSQLKLGIWGGRSLPPQRFSFVFVGQLNLQIPWQNLYTQPVEAVLDGVYLLIVPTASIKYDAEKEAKQLMEARQRELQRIEEAKQKIADQDKVKEEKQDTFVEKLVTQVIKNLQVKISNIHIRYEDDVSDFSKFHLKFLDLLIFIFCFQLVRLDNLFAYWNVKSEMFYHNVHILFVFFLLSTSAFSVFRPISAEAKLLMNPRSDVDFSTPKMDLDISIKDVAVEFNKPQYFSVMELLESIDMMTRNLPYRKYRPDVPLHNNAKIWWKYVIYGILEVNVQRRLQVWSWEHIRHHRSQVKNYRELYRRKITSKKPTEEILKSLEVSHFLLTFQYYAMGWVLHNNICMLKILTLCLNNYNATGLEGLMTTEEKAKLYAAIGYSETAVDPTLPKSYEAMKFSVNLKSMSASIRENNQTPELVKFSLNELSTVFTQRPGAQAIRFETKITSLEVTGMSQENCTPCLLSSRTVYSDNSTSLLSIMFETNPLDEGADQRLRIESQPLEIIYDAKTINSLVDFFRPPKDVHLEQLTSATLMKLEEFREKTSTGLLYVIETQKVLDLKINLMASYVIVPQKGFYDCTSNLLLLDLGSLKVGQSTIEDIMSRAYDSFDIQLTSIQLLYSKHDENWQEARKLKYSSQHILQPLDVKVEFGRAMVVTDARMPKFKLSGQLPLLSVQISDQKLKSILELVDSIPKAESSPATSPPPKIAEVRIEDFLSECSTENKGMISFLLLLLPFGDRSTLDKHNFFFQVNFSSLDVHLHTETLLNAVNYLNNLLPKQEAKVTEEPVHEKTEDKKDVLKKLSMFLYSSLVALFCFGICVLQHKFIHWRCSIFFLPQPLYITGKEVFNFKMISYVNATDGIAYTNMDVVDNCVYLTVGCIQVVFVNKFFSSILAFVNNFQAAKEALTEATVQAAEKAATGVKELAERSSRLALDINIKAPVVIIPQSAVSANVLVADLGLITVKNRFFIAKTKTRYNLPPVVDSMTNFVSLHRSCFEQNCLQTEVQLLQPLNLEVAVERNLAAAWYNEAPDIEISGRLKPMNLILSQEDITTILRTLNENIGESSGASPPSQELKDTTSHCSGIRSTSDHSAGNIFCNQVLLSIFINAFQLILSIGFTFIKTDDLLKLAEFKLVLMSAAMKMLSDGSMNASVKLANCTLDDKRQAIHKATPRSAMVEMKHGFEKKVMMDISYKQGRDGTVLDMIVQEIYLCASMEFLLTVADIFLKANAESAAAQRNLRQSLPLKEQAPLQPVSTMEMNVIVKNPEIVFVADLTRSDAPALVVTAQCEVFIKNSPEGYSMTAAVKEIQVKACPFLPEKRKGSVTTVLQPCDFFFEMKQSGNNPQSVSPIIINTVITITSALYQTAETTEEEISQVPPGLWNMKDLKDLKLWFLEESGESEDTNPITELVPTGQLLKMSIESVVVTLEAGVGHRTLPMLLAKSSFVGEVKNWTTLINLHSWLELEVHYFNEMFGVWEPLLEPLEIEKTDLFKPWILEIKKAKKALVESDADAEEENYKVPEYKTVISVSSKDQLNITLSKCGLQMLSNLGTAFAEAASQTSDIFKKDRAPFVLINSLGLPITVLPSDSFSVLNVEFGAKIFNLKDGDTLNMEYVRTKSESEQFTAMTTLSSKRKKESFLFGPQNHSTVEKIPLTKVGRCIYRVRHEESGVERSIVCQIDTVEGSKMINIRSPIQIKSHFSIPFSIFDEGKCLGTASPENEFNIPLSSYRYLFRLLFLDGEYDMCKGITFDEIMKNVDSLLQRKCQSVRSTEHSLIINIVTVKDTLTSSLCSDDQWDFPYVVHLWPSVLLRNLLPYHITYSVQGSGNKCETLQDGCSAQIHNAVLDQTKLDLQLLNYLDQNWKSEYHIKSNLPEISFTTFYSITDFDKTELDIAVHVTYMTGQMVIAIHSPYWMVNKTGRMLQYKADGIHRKHPPDCKKPLLFSFQPKNFLQNNKVQLMVTDSELSDQFSLDTVGSHGSVKCKSHKKDYQVGVTINNSSFNITRIVTFTPFFMISNRSKYTLEVAEEGKEKWIPIVLQQCIPFWPENDANKLLVRVENSHLPPKKINFDKQENCLLLHLDNKLGGITVDVNLTEHSTVITFSDYHDGAAPFLLINHTEEEIIEYGQRCVRLELEGCLQPNKAVLYTWADPAGSRKLTWKCGKRTEEIAPKEVCRSAFNVVYLVSFFEGLQRIVLITEDKNVFKLAYESVQAELAEQEIILSLQDVGISLVNNYTRQEVSYIGITSSDVVWEAKPKKKSRWKPMSVKQTDKLEQEFKEYSELTPSENKTVELEPNVLVILIIIQNQIPGAIFPFVFYPIKPPKSITLDSESLQEELMSVSSMDTSQISLYEYFHISPIKLHLSFSLSTGGEDSNKEERKRELIPLQSLNLLLKSIGATLTDVQDVVFKLAFFELSYHFCTTQQLQSAVTKHYSKQAIKQMYVLILGLDVLGNPFGFIRGLSEGVEAFFYEPYQGAIQGPEEFIEGMALGLKALVGGAVGGLAGAASRITGAMAKGVAAITMDEDYQQKRREAMNKQPTGLREGITRGGKGLVSGFVSGITGIVTKPIRGAQKEGAAGFFKGVGKGLVGAVARPTGGIIDMASSTFQGIKKVADSTEDVVSLRPPRFFGEDGVVRPYRLRDGTGSQMLQVKK